MGAFRNLMACGIFSLIAIASAQAVDEATTVPEGFITFTFPAGSIAAPSVTAFSLCLQDVANGFVGQVNGKITSVTASTITNDSAGWSAGALSQKASPYFIRITSGNAVGRTFQISTAGAQQNTATTVTIFNQGTPLDTLGIQANDTYTIFNGDTLMSLFGTSVLGASAAANADVVRLYDGIAWSEYFYNTTVGQWRKGSVPVSQNDVVISPETGVIFYRKGSTPLSLVLLGRVPNTDIQTVVNETGATFLGNAFPVSRTIGQRAFQTMPSWINNTGDVNAADKISFFDGVAWNYYNYNQAAGQWRRGSVPVNQGNIAIPAGAPVIIESPTGVDGKKVWRQTMPYTL